jgi:protease secretion system outer membrane protein
VASVSNNKNESVSTLNQAYHQKSLGLQLNVPLYSGGYVSASAAQALADQEKAQAELEAEQFSVAAEVQRLVLAISSAPARLDALQMALDANVLLLEAARRGVVGGVRMQADIDLARQRVAESARDLAKARYEVALSQIRLHARAGTSADALAELADSLFAGPSTAGNAP